MADRTVVVALRAAVGQFNAAMAQSAAATRGVQTATTGMATAGDRSMTKMGRSATGLRGALGGISPLLIGAGGLAFGAKQVADAAIGWESAFAGVRKTVDGTPEELQSINDGLRDMTREIPASAEELAGIAESAGQLGIETDNVLEFTETIAKLGETTNLVGEQGATQLARFANITGMSQDNFDRLASTIVALGNNMATTESEISEFALRIAGAGAQIGLSEDQILAVGAALSSVGINAEAGGTAISKIMIEIASQVETGGDKLAMFAEVAGMTSDEFATAWREDAAGALSDFIVGLGGVEEAGGNTFQVLEELGITEQRMRDALLRASGAQDLLTEALDLGAEAWAENNALTEEFNQRAETTEAKMQIAKESIRELGREIGTGLLPVLGEAAELLTTLLTSEPAIPGGGRVGVFPERPDQSPQARSVQMAFDPFATAPGLGAANAAEAANALAEANARAQQSMKPKALQAYSDRMQGLADMYGVAGDSADDLTEDVQGNNEALEAQAAAAEASRTAVSELAAEERAASDPVFAMERALDDVESAQRAYTKAVEKHGPKSKQAEDAAFDLASAVSGAEQAALDGDLSFSAFDRKLGEWVDQGRITAGQADTIRRRVRDLRGEAEDYQGAYWARIEAATNTAEDRLREIRSIIGDIPRSISTTVSVGFTSSGGPVARIAGRGQFLVGTGHDGGWIGAPRLHDGGMLSDEVPAVLQRGEFVVNRQASAANAGLLEAINSGAATGIDYRRLAAAVGAEMDARRLGPPDLSRLVAVGNRTLSRMGA